MSRSFYRFATFGLLWAIATSVAMAQTPASTTADDHLSAGGPVCGYHVFNDGKDREALANTARTNPTFYRQLIERAKRPANANVQRVADDIENTFVVRNRVTGNYDPVTGTLVYSGRRARIWVDNAFKTKVKQTTINALARGVDSVTPSNSRNPALSIIENDEQVFGTAPPHAFDETAPEVQDFFLTDIKDGLIGAFVGGYFSPWDQTDNPGSNKMNLLYIDCVEGLGNQSAANIAELLNTLAHEFQHLIHYRTNSQSEVFFNEGCSEVASILNGYITRSNSNYLKNTNLPFLGWNSNDGTKVLLDYERAMTFVHYITEQCGEKFLTAFAATKTTAMDRVSDALQQIGDNRDWRDLFSSWVVANYVGKFNAPYAYTRRLSSTTPTAHGSYNMPYPDSGSINVQQYASVYLVYNKPGALKVNFHAGQPIRTMAILYKGSAVAEVWQLDNNVEYTIGTYATYDKIVFAVANLAFNGQTVKWDVSSVTLGVNDPTSLAGSLAINGLMPNPANNHASIDFTTATAGTASVRIYDVRGALVRTLASDGMFEAGAHHIGFETSDMPAGTYFVRVTQNNVTTSRTLVVAR